MNKYEFSILTLIIISIIVLSMLHIIPPTNPIVEFADDIACEETDEDVCKKIKELENNQSK